jgi:crotonobetaine/carnitine-CoA ligase
VVATWDDKPLSELTINDVLENRADHFGDRTLIRYGEEETDVSFAELDAIANAIGNSLRDMTVEPQDNVSVMFRDHLRTIYAHFGINKAGGVYCPINFEYKGQTLTYQINDTEPEVLLVEDRYIERLNEIRDDLNDPPEIVVYETDAESEPLADEFVSHSFSDLLEGDTSRPDVDVGWDDPTSIIYTSGTTGLPKGCVIPHRYVLSQFGELWYPLLTPDDVVHCALPLYHIGGLYFIFMSGLTAGSQVSLWDRVSTDEFWDRVEKYQVTQTALPLVVVTWLAKQPERADDRRNTLNKVHMQPLPESYEEVARRFGFDFLTSGFGQTESGYATVSLIHSATGDDATPAEIRRGYSPEEFVEQAERAGFPVVESAPAERFMGKPREDIFEAAILDDRDERLPPNEVGELALRPKRPGLILTEYYGKPEKTVEDWQNLWFHTGDNAYRDEEDNFFFVDRKVDAIRRRGENISSIQIQEIVNEHDAVGQTAAFPVPAEEGGEDEVAVVVQPRDGADLTRDELRSYFGTELPEFMRPKYVELASELPTTETSKIKKYKLRENLIEKHSL